MKPFSLLPILCFMLISFQTNAAPQRLALIIGNAQYEGEPSLENTLNDARDMTTMLRHLGFQIQELENLDARHMRREINDFLDQTKGSQDIAILYFSGHAVQDSNRSNYLLPVDAQIKREAHIRADGISVDRILDQFSQRPDGAISLLVLDACRNHPFATHTRGSSRGLARLGTPPGGTLVLYAASPGQTADDNPNEHNGLFTKHLLQQLPKAGQDIEDAFEQVALSVKQASGNQQIPYKEGNLLGKHYLAAGPEPAEAKPQPTQPNTFLVEQTFWQDSKSCGTQACLQSYLSSYPQGQFAGLARAMIASMQQPTNPQSSSKGDWSFQENPNPGENEFLFPDSDRRLLGPADISGLSKQQLWQARNEIFARKGHTFTTPKVRAFFRRMSYYRPREGSVNLSQIERMNVSFLRKAEHDRIQASENNAALYFQVVGLDPNGDGFLSIRSCQSSRCAEIGRLYNGCIVLATSSHSNWIPITAEHCGSNRFNIQGYVFRQYLKPVYE